MTNEHQHSHKFKLFALIGPGLLVAATGVGAGDLATASFAGSLLGNGILWAAVLGAFLKYVVNEGLARWQLATGNTIIEGGTAIGMGLATAVNRIKDSKALSKVIILLTDGVNNSGFIDPKIASELAVEYGIKTYTIGLGTNGMALSPIAILPNGNFQYGRVQVEIDEDLLKEIAEVTGGKYFRATNNKKLIEIYNEINKLEKTEIEEFKFYNYEEKYRPLVLLAGLLLLLELLFRITIFRSFI